MRFFPRNSGLQAANQFTAVVLTIADYVSSQFQQGKSAYRKPNAGHVLVRPDEIFGRKPDDREWLAVELDRLSQNFTIGIETALPKIVAEHHDRVSRARLLRNKGATHSGVNSEHREVILGHQGRPNQLGTACHLLEKTDTCNGGDSPSCGSDVTHSRRGV